MQHVVNVKTKSDLTYSAQPELIEARYCEPARIRQEEDISKLVECMALNSASSSEEEESEASEVDSFLIEEGASGSPSEGEPEPEFLLSRPPGLKFFLIEKKKQVWSWCCGGHAWHFPTPPGPPHSPPQAAEPVDPETQARLEALLEAAGISRLTGESKQLADPDVLKRLTSSVRYHHHYTQDECITLLLCKILISFQQLFESQ